MSDESIIPLSAIKYSGTFRELLDALHLARDSAINLFGSGADVHDVLDEDGLGDPDGV